MNRKWTALGATMTAALLLAAGIGYANDDKSPLHEAMEKVQTNNGAIVKNVRTAAAYTKGKENVVKAAKALVELSKEAKPLGEETAKKQKKSIDEWNKLSDSFIKEAETFSTLVGKADTTQAQAKEGYKAVSKSCTACHDVFRVEE